VCGRRTKWFVLVLWLIAFAIAGPLSAKLNSVQINNAESYLPGSAESTQVINLQREFRSEDALPAVVVYVREGGITEADQAAAQADRQAFLDSPDLTIVGDVPPVIPSEDGQALQIVVPLLAEDGFAIGEDVDVMRAIATTDGGLVVKVDGPAGIQGDFVKVFDTLDVRLLGLAALVVIVILLFTYRSPVLWLLPLISVFGGLTLAQTVVYLLAKNDVLVVNGQTASILTVLVFGAGTDYALLLVARYREELRRHDDRHEAMAEALHKAGPAIIASATTVAVGLLCLLVSDVESSRALGPVAAIGVACALLAMLTLLPALLVVLGRWAFWPRIPHAGSEVHEEQGVFARLGRSISGRPRAVWVGTALVLGLLALNAVNLEADGLPQTDAFITAPDSVLGQELIEEHFPAGTGSPVIIIGPAADTDAIVATATADPGIAGPAAPPQNGGDLVEVQVTLSSAPDSPEADETIKRLRSSMDDVSPEVLVGGATAVNYDVQVSSQRDNRVVIPLVLLVVFIVLMILLRAIVAPLMLMATVVLSFLATLGVSAFVFTHIFHFAGADGAFPLFAFIFLVALGIDYNIFLMTRVREESVRIGTRPGILRGLAVTGGVITSAGIVLAATFAVLGTLPLVFTAQIGFVVAFGVLLDTTVVRSILVPALGYDIGRSIWWPSSLGRESTDADPT
jgi:RND superfamily putative drug exporter